MTISVIIPAYKAADTIERALSSVAEQTLKPKQIIVIDDGSNDDTLKIVESFKEHIYEIEIIIFKQQNLGAGAARNRAINAATGEWLAFLDADDEWHPKKLSTSMDAIRRHNLVLVSHNYYRIDKTSKKPIFCSTRFEAATNPYRGLYRKGFIATSSVVVLRDAVLSVGGFDETLKTAQDFDLWLKILKKCEPSEGRGKIHNIKRYKKKFKLIDESYNANPLSVKNAISNFNSIKKKKFKKYLLLGDMLELGKKSNSLHENLSKVINNSDIDKVFVKGKKTIFTYKHLKKEKRGNILHNIEDIDLSLSKIICNNDYLMIKGSNATGLNNFSKKMIRGT